MDITIRELGFVELGAATARTRGIFLGDLFDGLIIPPFLQYRFL